MKVANVNGTVYIYGGQATTQSGQTANTWSKYHTIYAGSVNAKLPSRQRLSDIGSDEHMGNCVPTFNRPSTTLRPTCGSNGFIMEFL
jgi:hypothetical protein